MSQEKSGQTAAMSLNSKWEQWLAENIRDITGSPNEPIDRGMDLIDDLGLESLEMMDLIARIENSRTGIRIRDKDLEDICTVGELLQYLEKKWPI